MYIILALFLIILPTFTIQFHLFNQKNLFSTWIDSFFNDNFFEDTSDLNDDIHESILKEQQRMIDEINAQLEDFELGINPFSNLSSKEFVTQYCGTSLPKRTGTTTVQTSKPHPLNDYTDKNLPESISWKKYVSPVRNQKRCGSCWAVATMSMIEAHNRIKNKRWNNILSPQYLVDCDEISYRCHGGWPSDALDFLKTKSNNKAPKESVYPYTGRNNDECQLDTRKVPLNINTAFEIYLDGNERQLRLLIANYGPVVIAMNVSEKSKYFQQYRRGIFYDPKCVKSDNQCRTINHSMLVVGYGKTSKGKKYFEVQNSWGKDWGEDGFGRIAMDRGNNCNVACYAFFIA